MSETTRASIMQNFDTEVALHTGMDEGIATIKVEGKYSLFTYRDQCIRFRTSTKLQRYVRVKEWDHGYLVVDVDYSTLGLTEEYVDLRTILTDLYIDPSAFLKPIKEVRVENV